MNTATAAAAPAVIGAPTAVGSPGMGPCVSAPDMNFLAELLALIAPVPAATIPVVEGSEAVDTAEPADADEALAALTSTCPVEQIINVLPAVPVTEAAAPPCDADAPPAAALTDSLQRSRAVRAPAATESIAAGADSAVAVDVSDDGDVRSAVAAVLTDPATTQAAVSTEPRAAGTNVASLSAPSAAPQPPPQNQTVVATAAPAAPAEPAPAQRLHQSVGTARWADELGTRITLMATRGQQTGSLSLSPEHLGPLEVRINISQDTTNVWFGAQHADTRAALQEALPRLREMFAAAGLSLGQANVSREAPRQGGQGAEAARLRRDTDSEGVVTQLHAPVARRLAAGTIDTYA